MQSSTESRQPMRQPAEKSARRRRAILIAILALYALVGWLRLRESLLFWDYLLALDFRPRPLYLALSGGILGLLFSLAAIFYVFRVWFAPRFSRWLGFVFLAWFWTDRVWLSTREAFFNQLEIGVLIILFTLFWCLILIRKRDFFKKRKTGQEDHGEQTGTGSQILPARPEGS